MGKTKARKSALDMPPCVGHLREMIRQARGKAGRSNVNKIFSVQESLDIYEKALADRDDEEQMIMEKIEPWSGRVRKTADFLIATNVMRDAL